MENEMKKHLIVAMAALLGATAAFADAADRYRGTTLTVSWPSLGHFQNAEAVIETFEQETGINVEIDALPYLQLRDQQIEELSKRNGKYDLVSWVIMWKGEYVDRGLLSPLAPFFENSALADPDYDMDDIAKPYLVSGGLVGG
ncbi:MAG: extracellular solute-binding protein, partial [Litoreibacter sp.]|nr:extracellular solute-binding protein [Litoreibacter sp.]